MRSREDLEIDAIRKCLNKNDWFEEKYSKIIQERYQEAMKRIIKVEKEFENK